MGRDTPASARLYSDAATVRFLVDGIKEANEAFNVGIPLIVGLANGCYDLLHPGHVAMLEEAAERCDYLVVAIDDNARVRATKGPRRPTRDYVTRAIVVAGLRSVGAVLPITAEQPLEKIMQVLRPDRYFCRGDEPVPEAAEAVALNIKVWPLPRHGPWSTTEEIGRIGCADTH